MTNVVTSKPRIVVDERERSSEVPEALMELGASVDFSQLLVADYVVTSEAAVERKTIRDFLSSVYDGRLFKQCSELSTTYKKPFLILEGDLSKLRTISKNPKVFYGALTSVTLSTNINLLYTPSPFDTAMAILVLQNHLTKEHDSRVLLRKPKKDMESGLQQLYIVSSLPGVGEKLAERLLYAFKTPRRVFNASVKDLSRVSGVGMARALRIDKALKNKRNVYKTSEERQKKLH